VGGERGSEGQSHKKEEKEGERGRGGGPKGRPLAWEEGLYLNICAEIPGVYCYANVDGVGLHIYLPRATSKCQRPYSFAQTLPGELAALPQASYLDLRGPTSKEKDRREGLEWRGGV